VTLVDRLVASDPPLERLRLALRATVTILLAGGGVVPLMRAGVLTGPSALLGAMTGMWATLTVNDAAPRDRRITSALLPFAAAGSVTLTAFFDMRSQLLGGVLFVAVTFAGVWVRRYGRRGFALGQVAIFVMLFSMFLRIEPSQLPGTYVSLFAGAAVAFVVRYAVVRDDAHVVLHAAVEAFAARARLVREAAGDVLRGEPGAEPRLRAELVALNAAALSIDGLIAAAIFVVAPDERHAARLALLEAELAADAAARATIAHRADAQPEAAEAVKRARLAARDAADRAREALRRVLHAPVAKGADAPISATAGPPPIGATPPATRLAIQAAVAAALSMALGTLVPPHLFFWAVLTAFLVYTGTASASEARRRAWSRAGGTAIGVALGFVLVAFVHGMPLVEAALAVVSFFLSMYTFRISYFAFTFFITALVAMAYELVGRPPNPLLVARLVETVVGSLCGAFAATLVLPLRTRAVVAFTAKAFVHKLRDAVRASVARLAGAESGADDPLDAARALDAALQELLARIQPLVAGAHGAARDDAHATVAALIESGVNARDLCDRALRAPGAPDGTAASLRRAGDAVDRTLRAFETLLDGRPETVPGDVATANAAETEAARAHAPPDLAAAAHDLRRIAEIVERLATPASLLRDAP